MNHLASTRTLTTVSSSQPRESVHTVNPDDDKLDLHLERLARHFYSRDYVSTHELYQQYQHEAGTVIDRVVPYEERLLAPRRAHMLHKADSKGQEREGDGLVLVVHIQLDFAKAARSKTVVCSGFVVDASIKDQQQGDTIVTCAHTLEQAGHTLH